MANTKTEKPVTEKIENVEERVPIYIERAKPNEDPNFYVSINFKTFLLPRGKTSMVPRYVYDEIMRSRSAENKYEETVDNLKAMSKVQ
ncbi:MAG: hypothetical protein IIX86_09045 [Clostridia bacterium]|nr:hypothetical protein [Clostridia bacterium]